MKENVKYILSFFAIIIGIILLWYFRAVVLFVFISSILSLVARPGFEFFRGKYYKKIRMTKSMAALTTILLIWSIMLGFVSFVIPFVIEEIQFLSKVNFSVLLDRFEKMTRALLIPLEDSYLGKSGISMIKDQINELLISIFDFNKLQSMIGSLVDFFGNTFIALFSISFITFFLLKDEWLLLESIKLVVPKKHYFGVEHMLGAINKLLRRYFIGIVIQIVLVSVFVVLGFLIIGLEFRHALIIGLFTGIINIVPYLGPLIGGIFGILVSMVVYLQLMVPPSLLLFLGSVILVFVLVQLMDNILFQPLIFSSSVKAHPLEIFLIILMAGYISGMPGMFLAIPVYTIVRVIAKEFFYKYNVVQKLTGKL